MGYLIEVKPEYRPTNRPTNTSTMISIYSFVTISISFPHGSLAIIYSSQNDVNYMVSVVNEIPNASLVLTITLHIAMVRWHGNGFENSVRYTIGSNVCLLIEIRRNRIELRLLQQQPFGQCVLR